MLLFEQIDQEGGRARGKPIIAEFLFAERVQADLPRDIYLNL
jgi:hypothetical protein